MIYALVFIFGAIIGSFLNVVIKRYNTGESIVYSDSCCFTCGKKLSWSELIPICSFLMQKGRCRGCHSKISRQYPLVEFLTGLLFLSVFLKFFPDLGLVIFYWIVSGLLIIISVYDFYHQIIPDKIVYLLIFFALGYWFFAKGATLIGFLVGLSFFLFFFLLWLVSRGRWMGFGDSKIALAAGWILGFENGLIAMIFSFWIGAILGIFLLLFSKKNITLKSRIPFGPFLSSGIIIAFLFGESIVKIYFNIFL